MKFFANIAKASIALTPVETVAVMRRQRASTLRMRHPAFPLANEPGARIRQPVQAKLPRPAVQRYSAEAAKRGYTHRIDPQGLSRIFGLTGSMLAAAEALLG